MGNSADYRESVSLTAAGAFDDVNDAAAAAATRRPRRKSGFYAKLEQSITDDLGAFAHARFNDGRSESRSFSDIERSFSGGLSLKGTGWGRPNDTVGTGTSVNAISPSHRAFFAQSGLGLLIGDGRLNYAPERAIEVFYAVVITKAITVTFDYQHVENLAYRRDRGPADFFATRFHVDF